MHLRIVRLMLKTFVNFTLMNQKYDILVVGCGLSGCVIADLYSKVLGKRVLILEKRNHIGGNCYDYIDENGILINKYGAHLFHTNNERVWKYVQKYSSWIHWDHKVLGTLDGKYFPIPVNIDTINTLVGDAYIKNTEDAQKWLSKVQINSKFKQGDAKWTGKEAALSNVGTELYNKIFKHYTKKQWNKYPEELDGSVLARIPVNKDYDDRYFKDKHQALPENGYTKWFEKLLDNPNIKVCLNSDYNEFIKKNNIKFEKIFYTGPIDMYYSSVGYPKLEYRTINFQKETIRLEKGQLYAQPNSVVNYPGKDELYTRIVEYKHFLHQRPDNNLTTIVKEFSKDIGVNDEPYYPVPNEKNKKLYEQYKKLSQNESNVYFIGRLANYKYFNMDQAIENSISFFENLEGTIDVDTFSKSQEVKKDIYVILNECYSEVLKRNIDESGLKTYTNVFKKDTEVVIKEKMKKILYNSDEYKNLKDNIVVVNSNTPKILKKCKEFMIVNCKKPLSWIYVNYENLPEYMIFSCGHQISENQHKIYGSFFGNYVQFEKSFTISREKIYEYPRNCYKDLVCPLHHNYRLIFGAKLTSEPLLVVSRYTEDISWTKIFKNVIIYNKGPDKEQLQNLTNHKVICIPNEGREGETYLHHIIDNYSNLSNYIVFCQGCPFEHSPEFLKLVKEHYNEFYEFQPLTWRWKDNDKNIPWLSVGNSHGIPPRQSRDASRFMNIADCKIYSELLDNNFSCIYPYEWTDIGFNKDLVPRTKIRENINTNKPLINEVYKELGFPGMKTPEYFPFLYAANFGTTASNIKKHSVEHYKNARKYLLRHPDHGYIMERMWYQLFGT